MRKSRQELIAERDARFEWNSHKHKDDLKERYVKKFRALYGDKFEYPDADFYSQDRKISIICPVHGLFRHTIQTHLSGRGCPYCNPVVRKNGKRTTYERLAKTKKTRNIGQKEKEVKEKVKIIKEKRQIPKGLSVFNKGIPSKGEVAISSFLDKNGIKYYREWKLPNEYLFNRRKYVLADFYLPEYNTIIEYNGQQHYFHVGWFGCNNVFEMQQERDYGLRLYCKEHGIRLIEISYKDVGKIAEILKTKVKNLNK